MQKKKLCSKTIERSVRHLMSGFFTRKKKRSSAQEESSSSSEDSRLMRRNKAKNLHLFLSENMRKLKHSLKKDKPQHDKMSLGKKRRFQRSLSPTKDHFFLERMTSIPQRRSHQEQHHGNEENLSEMSNNEDSDQNSTVLSRSASDDFNESETFADDYLTIKEIESVSSSQGSSPPLSKSNQIDDILTFEAYDGEKEGEVLSETSHEESLPQVSLVSVASPSHYISRTEEYNSVLEPLFIEYEISPARGEAKRQSFSNQFQSPMDEKERVFNYVKEVLDGIDSSWEEMYLKTEFSDQILNPALISNIPFYPSQLCADHELLFDCINELLFEFCRFPPWVVSFAKPITRVFSFSDESIVQEIQKEVYYRLFPLKIADSLDQVLREDMYKPRNWLDVRCELECIGFETSELILNELLEQVMLDL